MLSEQLVGRRASAAPAQMVPRASAWSRDWLAGLLRRRRRRHRRARSRRARRRPAARGRPGGRLRLLSGSGSSSAAATGPPSSSSSSRCCCSARSPTCRCWWPLAVHARAAPRHPRGTGTATVLSALADSWFPVARRARARLARARPAATRRTCDVYALAVAAPVRHRPRLGARCATPSLDHGFRAREVVQRRGRRQRASTSMLIPLAFMVAVAAAGRAARPARRSSRSSGSPALLDATARSATPARSSSSAPTAAR